MSQEGQYKPHIFFTRSFAFGCLLNGSTSSLFIRSR